VITELSPRHSEAVGDEEPSGGRVADEAAMTHRELDAVVSYDAPSVGFEPARRVVPQPAVPVQATSPSDTPRRTISSRSTARPSVAEFPLDFKFS
jgi:hypothetical protein